MEAGRDLHREPLLELEIPREQLHDPCQLGEAEDTLGREVYDVSHAIKRQHGCMHSDWNGMSRTRTSSS